LLRGHFTDTFTFSWSDMKPYIFPPFSLIGKVIDKILSDKVIDKILSDKVIDKILSDKVIDKILSDTVIKAIIIVSFWPTQSWFPLLISALVSLPARIPRHTDLLKMPHTGELHPMKRRLNLVARVISGDICAVKDFRRTLSVQ
jgi:hypothetical protein